MRDTCGIFAIDVGGTFIKYGLFSEDLEEISGGKKETPKDTEGFISALKGLCDKAKEQGVKLLGIGISMPGFIDPVTGENTDFSIPPCFTERNIKTELEDYTGLKVVMENDSNCAAIGEMAKGAGKDLKNFVMVTVGTGLGGATVLDGKLLRGSHFKSGELGFCYVGNKKNPEATSGLVDAVREYTGDKNVNGEYIFAHMEDPGIKNIYDKWLCELAMALGNYVTVLDVDCLLVGGGISEEPRFVEGLKGLISDMFYLEDYTDVRPCSLGNNAGKIGAAYLALKGI
ncbi:MAG: ROK family protein [Lachnospiraceae bacterium]|nr:ROK family protein [Lachnospiraceae bacterium]